MGIDIGAQRENYFEDLSLRIMLDDPNVDVEFTDLDHHRCFGCFGDIDEQGYEVKDRHGIAVSVLYFHSDCYSSLLEKD